MRLVSARQEADYRDYRIVGAKQGTGMLLRVIPTRPNLPILKHSRFWTLRAPWVKAVETVCGYIDDAYGNSASQFPPKGGLAMTIALVLLSIVAMEHPFAGLARVEPEAFKQTKEIFDTWSKPGVGQPR